MGVNAANAGTAGTSWSSSRIRNKNGPISARNLRRIAKKKSKKTKNPKWEGDIIMFLDQEGKLNERR
jgi:hypothetical protein